MIEAVAIHGDGDQWLRWPGRVAARRPARASSWSRNEQTLLIPDRRGNNRADSLNNLVADPRIALLFMIPGVGETLRVNGTAEISVDPSSAGTLSGARASCRAR